MAFKRQGGRGGIRRWTAVAIGTCLALAMPVNASAASAESTATAAHAARAASGPLVVTGAVVQQSDATKETIGRSADPAATEAVGGATVRLVWESNAGHEEEMSTWAMVTVAETTTDSAGRYELRATPTPAIEAAAQTNDQWVNFWLHVLTPDGHLQMTAISRALVDGQWTGRGREGFEPTQAMTNTLAFDRAGKILNGTKLTRAQLAAAERRRVNESPCYYIVDSTFVRSTRVGDFHNTTGIDSYWQYGRIADSDIDAGVQYSGGRWAISGSKHIGTTGSATETHAINTSFDRYVRTNFAYSHYHETCYYTRYLTAYDWKGGAQYDGDTYRSCNVSPYSSYRTVYRAGDSLNVISTRATRVGYAVDAGVLHLGQTSGYSYSMDMYWKIKATRVFCGARDYPAGGTPGPGVIYNQYP